MRPHEIQGWYSDPYGVHEDRYFSAGRATKLIRDAGQESYHEPPAQPYDPAELVPAVAQVDDGSDGIDLRSADEAERSATASDLRRADQASAGKPYDAQAAQRAALDAFDRSVNG
ncbi:MAG TPA: hypothetical protein VMA32_01770 [Streptosporangiaceae bacterium]|nr:hypothetical protein [Streptosporangiaceae bacterium]